MLKKINKIQIESMFAGMSLMSVIIGFIQMVYSIIVNDFSICLLSIWLIVFGCIFVGSVFNKIRDLNLPLFFSDFVEEIKSINKEIVSRIKK